MFQHCGFYSFLVAVMYLMDIFQNFWMVFICNYNVFSTGNP